MFNLGGGKSREYTECWLGTPDMVPIGIGLSHVFLDRL